MEIVLLVGNVILDFLVHIDVQHAINVVKLATYNRFAEAQKYVNWWNPKAMK
jgi:hypothetical protein